jgi:hypothetical protein
VADLLTRVARLRALLAEATPGPWAYEFVSLDDNSWCIGLTEPEHAGEIEEVYNEESEHFDEKPEVIEFVCESGASENRADAALIAESHNALADMLDAAERWALLAELAERGNVRVISMQDAIEAVEREARERGGKERG